MKTNDPARPMPAYLEYDPAVIERTAVYRLLTGAVVPRPIRWASTVSADGISNLAPFSFFTVVCVIPPMVSLTIVATPMGAHAEEHPRDARVLRQRGHRAGVEGDGGFRQRLSGR
jgi:flavin reductase (DIM6/NTAB) family NADH-FMN oxidoreductase RutF